ncbi:MAG: lipopolysaccharide transport periplasmic protein LptA [Syntrophobacteraceae bacterium]
MGRIDSPRVFPACFILALFLSLIAYCPAYGAGANKVEKSKPTMSEKMGKSESPIHITAERMEAKQDDRSVIFEGNVHVQQDDLTLTGNRLKVVALPGDKSNPAASTEKTQKIDYIEVDGNVKVTQKDRLARADRAIFYQKDQKIVLHGHPMVMKGQDKIEGNLITIYLQQGRSVVEGGSGTPVQAVLFPGKKD